MFLFHNKLTIKYKDKIYTYFNLILPTIFEALSNSESYISNLALGNGRYDNIDSTITHLSNFVISTNKNESIFQSNIENGTLFSKTSFLINSNKIDSDSITEIGLCNNDLTNPKIYNYFSLISPENPVGIVLTENEELLFEITIYLTIDENDMIILCSGDNPFIKFLLGNGISDVFACRGLNYTDNTRIEREFPTNTQLYLCTKTVTESNNQITINFQANIEDGETNEILFITNNIVFARQNLKEFNQPQTVTETLSPKGNYIIDINIDTKSISSVKNLNTMQYETNYFPSKYANAFGSKISLPFNNMFNSQTQRFLSKDGDKIFFILDNVVYAYKNENYILKQIKTYNINIEYITKIISFENYIFVISKIEPYINTFIINGNIAEVVENDFEDYAKYSELSNCFKIDITLSKNENFMLAYIDEETKYGNTLYFNYSNENGFEIDSYLTSEYEFNYLLAMYKNNFCDARIMYLKEGEYSYNSRIVTHFSNKSTEDVYTALAYIYTHNTKDIYAKSRAIVAEKTTSPSLIIYYYPQIYEYQLPLISNEIDDYISNNLNYFIQKINSSQYKIYNLIGYDQPELFDNNFPEEINQSLIEDFEFLNDTILIFQNDINNPIIAYNLNLNKTQIENVSNNEDSYEIELIKYNKLGTDEKDIIVTFSSKVDI